MPAPFSWPPSEFWDGDDGSWSSFSLRVGEPEQVVRVLPSTAGQATWVVTPEGCPPGFVGTDPITSCDQSRGSIFDPAHSQSWEVLGNYSLGLESNFGYGDLSATYGLDTVALGFSESSGGPSLSSQVVTGLGTREYYVGVFGLGNQGTNLTNITEPRPSFLTTMKSKNIIPSLSWAYTAGAPYQSKGVFGSLTFGGYDLSRFVPNDVTLSIAPDISRDLVVGLQSITMTSASNSSTYPQPLLPAPILTFVDSTIPYIYLPIEACQAFERALSLTWNDTDSAYYINDTAHETLLKNNPSFNFTIANSKVGGPSVDITLPYAAFDLEFKYPEVLNTTRYFPLQRADNESQYTLGRAFLQEAYLITDYERKNFSISQCKFEDNLPENIIAIPSTTASLPGRNHNLVIGATIGAVSFLLVLVITILIAIRRRRTSSAKPSSSDGSNASASSEEIRAVSVCSVREIDQNSLCGPIRELPDSGKAELLDNQWPSGSGNRIPEMSESLRVPPIAHELRTHRSSTEHLVMQAQASKRIFMSTRISQKSWTTMKSGDGTPQVETIISASVHTSSIAEEIYSSYLRKPLDLNRSLPATPISESSQLSPSVVGFDRQVLVQKHSPKAGPAAPSSISPVVSSKIPASKYSRSWSGGRPSLSLQGLETVIPPGQSDTDLSDISALSSEAQQLDSTWL